MFICIICCKEEDRDYGNNPWPISEKGDCCETCNRKVVIPARDVLGRSYPTKANYNCKLK